MSTTSMSPQQIIDSVKKSPSNKVKIAVTDIDGILRGKVIHKDKFLSAAESGFGFCNVVFGWDCNDVVYDNVKYTGWHTGYPDAQAKIDLSTYREIPWEDDTPFFLADFVSEKEEPLAVCPRQLLKRTIARCQEMGFEAGFGLEFEWFNFQETPQSLAEKHYQNPQPITPGMFGYSILRSGLNREFFHAIMDETMEFQVPIEGLHTETGPGVYEAAILYSDALEAADRGVLFKTSVKEIAYRFQILPSFMAKWSNQLPGCSGHVHQSLWKSGENAFFDSSSPHKMSSTFESYLAGQMKCLPEILPMFVPNVNSYKRLVKGLWAPTSVTWGSENRTSAFRVIPGSSKSTRLETRIAGADINPYLAVAAALASGLYGIKANLKLDAKPVSGNAYEEGNAVVLPKTLLDATRKMSESKIARDLFGEDFVSHYVATREWEWRQFETAVTDWEIRRYFELS